MAYKIRTLSKDKIIDKMKKSVIRICITVTSVLVLATLAVLNLPVLLPGNFENAECVGNISVPKGYERISGNDQMYTDFLRSIPLKPKGAEVRLYKSNETARFGNYAKYAVIDLPLLSNAEQCADACMRLRAEYLFRHGKYAKIHFANNAGLDFFYLGGRSRKAFESYMRKVYGFANTASLAKELPTRALKDVQPGDILVYPARKGHKYGHAVFVIDVVQNKKGEKMVMLAEGCTPACDIHLIRNFRNWRNPAWFKWNDNADVQYFSVSMIR